MNGVGVTVSFFVQQMAAIIASSEPPVVDTNLDGGDAFTTNFSRDVDGGSSTTTQFVNDFDGETSQ
jgi:hypothetical protein